MVPILKAGIVPYAFCMLTHPVMQTHLNRVQFYIIKAMGVLLIAFGVKIATLSQIALPEMVLE